MELRPARRADRERILEICKTIWEGHDYIPNVIDKWLDEKEGEFTVVEDDGQVMGVAKLTMADPGIGWLEGLRVAPEARSRGYAKAITDYYISKSKDLGIKRLQLATYCQNHASIHVTESYGFQRITTFFFTEKEVQGDFSVPAEVCQLRVGDPYYHQVRELFFSAPEQQSVANFICYGWSFRQLNEERFQRAIAQENVFYLHDAGKIMGGVILYPDHSKGEGFFITMLTGSPDAQKILLDFACKRASMEGFAHVNTMTPNLDDMKDVVLQQGFKNWEEGRDGNVFIYELDLEGGSS